MNILIGISGGIAAYKVALLVRMFKKEGHQVQVIFSKEAHQFVTPLTFSVLSENEVLTDFSDEKTGKWNNHVHLASWADVILICPATSNIIAKMANGICDSLLLAVYQSARGKVVICPAMDLEMANHFTLKRNLQILEENNIIIIPSEYGHLASGLEGNGRMAEPETIFNYISSLDFEWNQKTMLITAGPTIEPIDPVRYISNHSSGKMGLALVNSGLKRGYKVILVSGPIHLPYPQHPALEVIKVQTAEQMFEAVKERFPLVDIAIATAAVADFKVAQVSQIKIKKEEGQEELQLDLVKNPDILSWMGHHKSLKQYVLGFALESNEEELNALKKLNTKDVDAIVLNSLQNPDAGFGSDNNQVTIFSKRSEKTEIPLQTKVELARHIISFVEDEINLV